VATFYQKLEIFAIMGAAFPLPGTDWSEILLGQEDPCAPQLCQISRESVQPVVPARRKCWFLAWLNLIPAV